MIEKIMALFRILEEKKGALSTRSSLSPLLRSVSLLGCGAVPTARATLLAACGAKLLRSRRGRPASSTVCRIAAELRPQSL